MAELGRALNRGLLPDDYYVLAQPQVGRDDEAKSEHIEPDVLTLERRDGSGDSDDPTSSGGLAVAEAPPRAAVQGETSLASPYATNRRT